MVVVNVSSSNAAAAAAAAENHLNSARLQTPSRHVMAAFNWETAQLTDGGGQISAVKQ